MRGLRVLLVVIATAALLPFVLPAGQAFGQQYPPKVSPTKTETPPAPKPRGPVVVGERNQLPFTGAGLTGFVIVGAGAIGTGAIVARRSRRRS